MIRMSLLRPLPDGSGNHSRPTDFRAKARCWLPEPLPDDSRRYQQNKIVRVRALIRSSSRRGGQLTTERRTRVPPSASTYGNAPGSWIGVEFRELVAQSHRTAERRATHESRRVNGHRFRVPSLSVPARLVPRDQSRRLTISIETHRHVPLCGTYAGAESTASASVVGVPDHSRARNAWRYAPVCLFSDREDPGAVSLAQVRRGSGGGSWRRRVGFASCGAEIVDLNRSDDVAPRRLCDPPR